MRNNFAIFFVALITGAVYMATLSGCAGNYKYEKYSSKDPELNISMDYLSGWKFNEDRGAKGSYIQVMFYPVKKGGKGVISPLVAVIMQKETQAEANFPTAEALAENIIKKRSSFKEMKLVSNANTQVLGNAGQDILLTYQTLDKLYAVDAKLVSIKERLVIFKSKDKFYTLAYRARIEDFDKFNKAFSHIVNSIKFKENK